MYSTFVMGFESSMSAVPRSYSSDMEPPAIIIEMSGTNRPCPCNTPTTQIVSNSTSRTVPIN